MKKHLLLKLLALFVVLITSIATAGAYTYTPTGVGQQAAQTQQTMQTQPAIQSHQMMHGGSSYQGQVYTPFSGEVPSEQGAAGSPARVSGPRKGRNPGDPTSDQKSDQSPVGEPWVMVFFALAFAGFITLRKHKLNQTTDMKKSIKYIATLALFLTLGTASLSAGKWVYLSLESSQSEWMSASARFAIYAYNCENSDGCGDAEWYNLSLIDNTNKVYAAEIDDKYTGVIFCRMDPSTSVNNWTNKWTQTGDLNLPTGDNATNCYWIKGWTEGSSSWKYYWDPNNYMYVDVTGLDMTSGNWNTQVWMRIGHSTGNSAWRVNNSDANKVANTKNLYRMTSGTGWLFYDKIYISNNCGNTASGQNIYNFGSGKYEITQQTEVIQNRATTTRAYTVVPHSSSECYKGGDNHYYYPRDEYNFLKTYTLTPSCTNGTIRFSAPNDGAGTWHDFAVGDAAYTIQSGNIHVIAKPDEGYELTSIVVNDGSDHALSNDKGGGYTFYFDNVRANITATATFTKIEEKKIFIYDSGNWKNARGKLFIHAWNATMGTDNGYGDFGPEMKNLGNGWYEATLSTEFTHFMISDSTNTHKSSDRAVSSYTDGGRYSTASGDIPSYAASEPNIAYVEVTKGGKTYFSNTVTNTTDTLSFFYPDGATAKLYYFSSGIQNVTLTTDFTAVKDNIITATWTGDKNATALTNLDVYDGDYNLHCYATSANYLFNGRGLYGTSGTRFIKFETSALFDDTYNYYWVDWFRNEQNVVATVGNKYNDNLAGVIGSDENAPKGKTKASGGNVRFSYNPTTNTFKRAIIDAGNEAIKITAFAADSVLVWSGSDYVNDAYTAARNFGDATNWMYSVKAKVRGTAHANIKSTYVVEKWLAENKKLIGGNKGDYYTVEIDYDFKTNRLIAAWTPGDEITPFSLESNLMAIRTENGAPTVLNIQKTIVDNEAVNLTNVTKIYTVMEFTQASWTDVSAPYEWSGRRIDDTKAYCDEYYWLSLPYDCYVGDIFGIEGYGDGPFDKWMIQRYRGDKRAKKGWWAEIESWWENMARTDTLKAGEGYVLRVTNLNGEYGSGSAFADASGTNKLYLYFPSMRSGVSLGLVLDGDNNLATSMTSVIPSHICELWRGKEKNEHAGDPNYDRRVIDSNWNLIGSPSFNSAKITTSSWQTSDPNPASDPDVYKPKETPLKYFYTWSIVGGEPKFAIQNAENYVVPATHAYLAQYAGTITWAPTDGNPLVELKAPKRTDEEGGDQTLKLVLMQDTVQADVTYISRMAEGATEDYDLNLDLSKVMNAGKSNIYTFAGYYKMAGNCLPDTTSIVPVGVKITADGDYTFAMLEGTNGTGVYLIDNIAGTRTNLALTDYTVNLAAGTYDGRFMLELSPIAQTPTDIDNVEGDNVQGTKVRKVMVDGILYVVKDGQVFDARGNRIQ